MREETWGWLSGTEHGLREPGERAVTPGQAPGPLWNAHNAAAGRVQTSLEAPIPTVQMRRLKPRGEDQTPEVLGVTNPGHSEMNIP